MSPSNVVSRIAHRQPDEAPAWNLSPPWWQHLDPSFSQHHGDFDLNFRDRLLVGATASMDAGIRAFAATAVGALALPSSLHPKEIARFDEDLAFYAERVARGEPADVFVAPSRAVPVDARPALAPLYSPPDGVVEDLAFDSPFLPSLPRLRAAWQRHPRNRRAVARLWRHHGPARPTVIAIHGFGAEQSWVNEWMLALPRLYQLGCDVLLVTLPFHGPRADLLSPFSGHGFFAHGIAWINECFAQAVHDVRVLLRHLRHERGAPRVGVMGLSLGGCTTALVAGVEDTLAFAMPVVPVTSLADLLLEWQPVGRAVEAALRRLGKDIHDLRHLLAASSPLTWRPLLPLEQRFVVGGVGDRVTPPKHTRLLWQHWEQCRLHWFPGGHVLHLDKAEYVVEIGRFLRDAGFLPERRRAG